MSGVGENDARARRPRVVSKTRVRWAWAIPMVLASIAMLVVSLGKFARSGDRGQIGLIVSISITAVMFTVLLAWAFTRMWPVERSRRELESMYSEARVVAVTRTPDMRRVLRALRGGQAVRGIFLLLLIDDSRISVWEGTRAGPRLAWYALWEDVAEVSTYPYQSGAFEFLGLKVARSRSGSDPLLFQPQSDRNWGFFPASSDRVTELVAFAREAQGRSAAAAEASTD